MSIILDNYETIVKTIVKNINNGTIISKHANNLQGLSVKQLFQLFTQEFNLVFHKSKTINGLTLEDDILGIPLPNKPLFISSIYVQSLGEILVEPTIIDSVCNNILFFDISNTNVPKHLITPYIVITVDYVSFMDDSNLPEETL